MPARITINSDAHAAFGRKWRIRRLWLFGSVLRDDFTADSDVDVLYEFEPDAHIGWKIVSAEEELAQVLGHRVDFVPEKYLSRHIQRHPSFKPELIYGEG